MTLNYKMEGYNKIFVKDLNLFITCRLCEGYFVDATTLVECLHTFCRGCILRYFENNKPCCPTCNTIYKKKSQSCFRSDPQIQTLVYKLVPSLCAKEVQRREDFYRSTSQRAGSSCSDDSVLEKEKHDMMNTTEETVSPHLCDNMNFFSPEDSISLSLEYYQIHLDTTDMKQKKYPTITNEKTQTETSDTINVSDDKNSDCVNSVSSVKNNGQISDCANIEKEKENCSNDEDKDKRFLQCPAGVTMKHLQKFVRMKFGLTADHKVDIIYKGEVLPSHFSLMDVAYTFNWEKKKPMRFFYRIFTPMKVRPIKIVNTTLSTGGKQLQIVPVNPTCDVLKVEKNEKKEESIKVELKRQDEETEDQKQDKERLFAHLQLQSKNKVQNSVETKKVVPEKMDRLIKDCVFEYEEPDQEGIKKFAEKRDREWALQKQLEEQIRRDDYTGHHTSKKRKKSKHSKNEFNSYKKRKLHAEITSNEKEDLKLKVKITTNGHKHKHHKNVDNGKSQISSKEKLLQMRQIRHKPLSGSGDEKSMPIPSIKISKDSEKTKIDLERVPKSKTEETDNSIVETNEEKKRRESPKLPETPNKTTTSVQTCKPNSLIPINKNKSEALSNNVKPNSSETSSSVKTPKPEVKNVKWGMKLPAAPMDRNATPDKQTQKTFLKTFQSYAEKYKIEKSNQNKLDNAKQANKTPQMTSITTNNKQLDRKIANLAQRCTIEPKIPTTPVIKQEKVEKQVTFNDRPKVITPQYPPGFTVSKIETGVKRKAEEPEKVQDKRPSLEITLINPPSTSPQGLKPSDIKPTAKRPPPATIPLERIKKSVNLKSGISIIPKLPERCDNIGALDLSKPNKSPEPTQKTVKLEILNSMSLQLNNSKPTTGQEKCNVQLSNLQMLSKVATEHPTLNKIPPNNANKPRPQMPSLQTIKPPSTHSPGNVKSPSVQRMPPKLNEIQKFRPINPQIRSVRPNQNQNIRNIPNPSLLINRQQNQNRMAVPPMVVQQNACEKKDISPKPATQLSPTTNGSTTVQKEITPVKNSVVSEQKVAEKQEIAV